MSDGLDPKRPNIARVYNYWLGGSDNYAADREQAEQASFQIYPGIADAVRANRQFVGRAVTWAAREGIGQFIDLGAGLPASPSVHETARAVLPGAHVAYVDNDPVVISHARALLATDDGVAAVPGDLRDPAAVLASEGLTEVIDIRRPACVILALVLHFSDAVTAREITAGYISALAPGSCVVLSVGGSDDPGGRAAAAYTAGALSPRPRAGRGLLRGPGPGGAGTERRAGMAGRMGGEAETKITSRVRAGRGRPETLAPGHLTGFYQTGGTPHSGGLCVERSVLPAVVTGS